MDFNQYSLVTVLLVVSLGLGFGIYVVGYFLAFKSPNFDKYSAYECGFDPFSSVSMPFDVRYYLVSILFIIFDVEISFLFPWSLVFLYIGWIGYFSVMFFLVVLTLGFVYEWVNGALEWSK